MRLYILYVVLGLAAISQLTYGQSLTWEESIYGQEEGLSSYANFVHKDSRGVVWIGTQFGLFRFDGQDFVQYDEKDGLPFRQIMEIFEDAEGWFWLHKRWGKNV